jgi:signal transduction histidine kinase
MAAARAATFGRHGIRQRVVLVVLIGTTFLVLALAWAGSRVLAGSRAQIAAERRQLAAAVAAGIERTLDDELQELATLAVNGGPAAAAPDASALLRQTYRRSRLLDAVVLVPFDGQPVIVEPPGTPALDHDALAAVRRATAAGRPALTTLPGGRGSLLLVPVRDADGRIVGAVAGRVVRNHPLLQRILAAVAPAPNGWAELRDGSGAVESTAGTPAAGGSVITGSAAVGELGWTLTIAQPARDALAPLYRIRTAAVLAVPAMFAIAVLLAWGAAESVAAPLALMTRAAERIAGGDLERPVPAGSADEAGRLARALDDMRIALKQRERDRVRGELLKRTLTAQEDERLRIARELHDETSQTINGLIMGLDAALARYPSEFTRARIADARALAGRLLEGVHRLILALRPSMLDDLGLASAIEWFARQQLEPLGVGVTFEASGTDRRLSRDVELAVFRAAQESIVNIARHAAADRVLIQYAAEGDRLLVEIEDDGAGFDPATAVDDGSMRGLGLAGMRERVALAGGTLSIESSPGSGTHVIVELPLGPLVEANRG